MESKSLQLNRVNWKLKYLSEHRILLIHESVPDSLDHVHQLYKILKHSINAPEIVDLIPAYESLCIQFKMPVYSLNVAAEFLSDVVKKNDSDHSNSVLHEIPVCYELGLDWDVVQSHTKLSKDEIESIHSSQTYTVAMLGFLPGFIFLDGLTDSIHCPRKDTARMSIPKGSVGIGGKQTGIYGLESPGGWQIIGQSPVQLFDVSNNPPIKVGAGDKVKFVSISEAEFGELKQL